MSVEKTPCGLVVFDEPLPPPLHERRPYDLTLAAALSLSPERTEGAVARLKVAFGEDAPPTDPETLPGPAHVLTSNNPVRFMVPLMAGIVGAIPGPVVFALPGGSRMTIVFESLGDA
jgi:hypothetical protein